MSVRQGIKHLLGYARCKINHVSTSPSGGVIYIGRNTKIVGGRNIILGRAVCIRPNVDLWCGGSKIEIGAGSEIGERCRISIAHSLVLGEKVLLSPNVYITDCDHAYEDVDVPVIEQGIVQKRNEVNIGAHGYVGINAVIIGNVSIGKHSIIGANSVVTKDVPDYCVAAGSPAKVIKKYNVELKKWECV